jgi:nucleoside-diphosphate-sugar epimerase
MMTTLVVGASGATGRLLTEQLLDRGHKVKAVVRSANGLPADLRNHPDLTLVRAAVLDLSDEEMARHVAGCDAVASCLGHNLSFRGIYGPPRRLVAEAVRRLTGAVKANRPTEPVRFVLMNTTAVRNRDLEERVSVGQRIVVFLLRHLLPPQADNEAAAEYLRAVIGQDDPVVAWVAVRPDTLVDEDRVSDFEVHPSPVRDAIFDAGKTSRINVGGFMADLITDDELWARWKGQMPVIYNRGER